MSNNKKQAEQTLKQQQQLESAVEQAKSQLKQAEQAAGLQSVKVNKAKQELDKQQQQLETAKQQLKQAEQAESQQAAEIKQIKADKSKQLKSLKSKLAAAERAESKQPKSAADKVAKAAASQSQQQLKADIKQAESEIKQAESKLELAAGRVNKAKQLCKELTLGREKQGNKKSLDSLKTLKSKLAAEQSQLKQFEQAVSKAKQQLESAEQAAGITAKRLAESQEQSQQALELAVKSQQAADKQLKLAQDKSKQAEKIVKSFRLSLAQANDKAGQATAEDSMLICLNLLTAGSSKQLEKIAQELKALFSDKQLKADWAAASKQSCSMSAASKSVKSEWTLWVKVIDKVGINTTRESLSPKLLALDKVHPYLQLPAADGSLKVAMLAGSSQLKVVNSWTATLFVKTLILNKLAWQYCTNKAEIKHHIKRLERAAAALKAYQESKQQSQQAAQELEALRDVNKTADVSINQLEQAKSKLEQAKSKQRAARQLAAAAKQELKSQQADKQLKQLEQQSKAELKPAVNQ